MGQSRAQILQFLGLVTQKVIQSVQLHISHQMRLQPSLKAIWVLSFTCFSVFGALCQFVETGAK